MKPLSPDNKKIIKDVAIYGGLIFIAYKVFKNFFSGENTKKEEDELKGYKKELADLKAQGILPTFTDTQYQAVANNIKKAFSGAETFTTELEQILSIINSVKNMADWIKLRETFGIQDISDIGYGSTKYTLTQLLADQLDSNVYTPFNLKEDNPAPGTTAWSYSHLGLLPVSTLSVLNSFLASRLKFTL